MKNIKNYVRELHNFVEKRTRQFLIILLMSGLWSGVVLACPTCIGVIEHNAPKFFSNDAYRSVQENQNEHVHVLNIIQEEEK